MTDAPAPQPQQPAAQPPPQSDNMSTFRLGTAKVARVITWLVYAYLIFVEIILGLGFFLLLFGANPSSGFVEWIYRSLDRIMEPFRGIFGSIELGTTGNDVQSVFEPSILFAMIIYGILAMLAGSLLDWLSRKVHQVEWEMNQAQAPR